ncbi:MAG: cytochrome c [Flavitalea sp.]
MKTLLLVFFAFVASINIANSGPLLNDKGKSIYMAKCAPCHGGDGMKGKFGAKNLVKSRLSDEELTVIISNGKRFMPSWKKKLSEEEIKDVKAYIVTLRK